MLKRQLRLSPEEVIIDFEIAAKIAFESVFDVKVIGCLFHFGQSLFKKLCAVGLKQSYIDNKDIQVWFKSVFCLALIPPSNVELQFELLENEMRYVLSRNINIRSKGKEFVYYFRKISETQVSAHSSSTSIA